MDICQFEMARRRYKGGSHRADVDIDTIADQPVVLDSEISIAWKAIFSRNCDSGISQDRVDQYSDATSRCAVVYSSNAYIEGRTAGRLSCNWRVKVLFRSSKHLVLQLPLAWYFVGVRAVGQVTRYKQECRSPKEFGDKISQIGWRVWVEGRATVP